MTPADSDDYQQWPELIRRLGTSRQEEQAIDQCEFLERANKIQRLLTWGILNPFGPTVNSLCLAADPTGKTGVLFAKMSNPFANSTVAYSALGGDSQEQVVPAMMRATASIKGATLIIPPTEGSAQQLDVFALVRRQMNDASAVDLSSEADRLKRFWLDPWARLPSMKEILAGLSSPPQRAPGEIPKAVFAEWWELATHPQHVIAEWRAIIEAWEGAIRFQRDSATPLAVHAMPADEALSFHRRLLNAEMAWAQDDNKRSGD